METIYKVYVLYFRKRLRHLDKQQSPQIQPPIDTAEGVNQGERYNMTIVSKETSSTKILLINNHQSSSVCYWFNIYQRNKTKTEKFPQTFWRFLFLDLISKVTTSKDCCSFSIINFLYNEYCTLKLTDTFQMQAFYNAQV